MRRSILWMAVIMTAFLFSGIITLATGQEKTNNPSDGKATEQSKADADDSKAIYPYRLDFSFAEVEDGKRINTRHYIMDLAGEQGQEIKIGTRVPVVSGGSTIGMHGEMNTQYQYIDVGTNIGAHLNRLFGGDVQLRVNCEVSNMDTTDPASKLGPIIRQIKIEGSTLLAFGKPILIGSADDPNSKRQFQLEVTVTKLR